MSKFKSKLKERFNWDVSNLAAYTDEQSTEILTDLVAGAGLGARVNQLTGVKGSQKIKLLNSTPALQSAEACGWTPEGGAIMTDVTISTERIKIQEDYCNEDLNGTWGQLLNRAGANAQDTEMPLDQVMLAYYVRQSRKLTQDLMFNGDTTSLNPNLAFYDGFVKLWDNDANLGVYQSLQTSITTANALSIALGLYNAIDPVLFDNEESLEIICGRETYRKIIENVYNDNNYHHTLQEETGAEPSFILPTTNIRVRAYGQLNGTDKMYAVPYQFMFHGTDLEQDEEAFVARYDETDEKLRFSTKWRSGVQYVFPQYFTRLELANS
jgi:hypothetical protein